MWCRQRSIAIWNRNMIVVAVAISTWCTNVALLIHGRSTPSLLHFFKRSESSRSPGFLYRYHTGQQSYLFSFRGLLTHCPQLHAEWSPTESVCIVLNPEGSKINIISSFVTDVILLLIMLVGLLRMRQDGTLSKFSKFLWRQVRRRGSRPLLSLIHFPCERASFGSSWPQSLRPPQWSVISLP